MSASSQSLRFILSLRMNSSFMTSRHVLNKDSCTCISSYRRTYPGITITYGCLCIFVWKYNFLVFLVSFVAIFAINVKTDVQDQLSPYLTELRLFCDNLQLTSRVGRKAVSKQSPVILNFLACVAKWRKVVAKILNMFKNFMRQNSSQNGRKVIAGVSKPSRTCRRPLAI